jgi:hypothetical protein
MYFGTKSYLKSTRNHTAKHALFRTFSPLIVPVSVSVYFYFYFFVLKIFFKKLKINFFSILYRFVLILKIIFKK